MTGFLPFHGRLLAIGLLAAQWGMTGGALAASVVQVGPNWSAQVSTVADQRYRDPDDDVDDRPNAENFGHAVGAGARDVGQKVERGAKEVGRSIARGWEGFRRGINGE